MSRFSMPARDCARLVLTCFAETRELCGSTLRSIRFAGLPEELRVERAPTKARHIDPQLFHLVIERSLRHLQQLERLVNPAVGPPQRKADEKSLQVLHDIIPGLLLSCPPQEL